MPTVYSLKGEWSNHKSRRIFPCIRYVSCLLGYLFFMLIVYVLWGMTYYSIIVLIFVLFCGIDESQFLLKISLCAKVWLTQVFQILNQSSNFNGILLMKKIILLFVLFMNTFPIESILKFCYRFWIFGIIFICFCILSSLYVYDEFTL